MRILVINGSPRGDFSASGRPVEIPRPEIPGVCPAFIEPVPAVSCSGRLAAAFAEGAAQAGHECVRMSLHELRHISPCRACYGCLRSGRCVVQDDMQRIYPELERADAVVFVSPLYYATIPAQLLALVNRLYPYWIDGIRYPELKGAGVIGVCADFDQSWDLFDATWHSIFREIGWPDRGIVHAPRFMEHETEYLDAAREFGRNF